MIPEQSRTVTQLRSDAITAAVQLMHGPKLPDDVADVIVRLSLVAQEMAALLPVLAFDVRHADYCPFPRPTGPQRCGCGLSDRLAHVPHYLFPPDVWAALTTPEPYAPTEARPARVEPWERRSK